MPSKVTFLSLVSILLISGSAFGQTREELVELRDMRASLLRTEDQIVVLESALTLYDVHQNDLPQFRVNLLFNAIGFGQQSKVRGELARQTQKQIFAMLDNNTFQIAKFEDQLVALKMKQQDERGQNAALRSAAGIELDQHLDAKLWEMGIPRYSRPIDQPQ